MHFIYKQSKFLFDFSLGKVQRWYLYLITYKPKVAGLFRNKLHLKIDFFFFFNTLWSVLYASMSYTQPMHLEIFYLNISHKNQIDNNNKLER